MYTVCFEVKTKARTVKGLNRAIKRQTGCADWYDEDTDLNELVREGFAEFKPNKLIIWQDGVG